MKKTVAIRPLPQPDESVIYCVTITDNSDTLVDVYTGSENRAEALVALLTSDAFKYKDISPGQRTKWANSEPALY